MGPENARGNQEDGAKERIAEMRRVRGGKLHRDWKPKLWNEKRKKRRRRWMKTVVKRKYFQQRKDEEK